MPVKSTSRIIVDINVWISCLLTPRFRQHCEKLFSERYLLLFSDAFLREYDSTVKKKELIKRISPLEVSILRDKITAFGTFIEVSSEVALCRDKKDDYLLALAKDGQADYLITRDEDLLSLQTFGSTKIMHPYDFENEIKKIENYP